jgi:serine/threonine protein kinase
MGTPAYVSPEQVAGKQVDHRTDIYSLGVVLYEMVTGRVPYQGETPMGVMFKHLYEPLPLPRNLMPNLPEEVERVILKAMAKEPDDRYEQAGELAEALQRAIREEPTVTPSSVEATIDTGMTPRHEPEAPPSPTTDTALPQQLDDRLSTEKEVASPPVVPSRKLKLPGWIWVAGGVVLSAMILVW